MAHRGDITQVGKDFPVNVDEAQEVTDPVCGMKLNRKSVRHMLFRPETIFYFCSRECEQKFMTRDFQSRRRAA